MNVDWWDSNDPLNRKVHYIWVPNVEVNQENGEKVVGPGGQLLHAKREEVGDIWPPHTVVFNGTLEDATDWLIATEGDNAIPESGATEGNSGVNQRPSEEPA